MDAQKLMDEACPTIGSLGWTYYFTPATMARGERLGLDVFEFYFLGRGGVLGDVDADVVQSAFGYFHPDVLRAMWEQARAKVEPRTAGREFFEACHDHGRAHLAGVDELEGFVAAASAVIERARRSVAGLTLFAAAAAEPVPPDPAAAATHQLAVLRELRGSAHLVAVVAEGLPPQTAHFLRRPGMYATFGWNDEEPPQVSERDTAALEAADRRTDALCAPAYAALDDDGAGALLAGLAAMEPRLTAPSIEEA